MALPPSGPISLNQVNTELGQPATQTIGLGDANVRALAQVPSGPISMSNLYGKSSSFNAYLAGGTDIVARGVAISQGWDQQSYLILNVTGNIVASTTGTYALTIQGAYPSGVRLNNGANILARGGAGGAGTDGNGNPGAPGGNAIQLSAGFTLDINNSGIIAAGGGGGGAGGASFFKQKYQGGGGGGGRSSNEYTAAGGAPNGGVGNFGGAGGGGSGPGAPGASGGNWGDAGGTGTGGGQYSPGGGGGGGAAVVTNGAAINYIAQGQIFGRIA